MKTCRAINKISTAFSIAVATIVLFSCNNGDDNNGIKADGGEDSAKYDIPTSQMGAYDPFIFTDTEANRYCKVHPIYNPDGTPAGLEAFESKDLQNWRKTGMAWTPSENFLGNNDCWAPDIYEFRGKHYIFVTFSRINDIKNISHWNPSNFEIKAGTTVLRSDNGPLGPYKEIVDNSKLNVTPSEWMCIDGSLYVDDNGDSWMIYSGELTEFYDGRVYAQRMAGDLTHLIDEPHLLFSASEAPWVVFSGMQNGHATYITDGPFIWKDNDSGNLILLWSSHSAYGYTMGQAISENGVLGPWKHVKEPLNTDNGGHGHIFKDLKGRTKLSYHSTKYGTSPAVMTIRDAFIIDGKLVKLN